MAHWAIYDNQPQPIGKAKIGSSQTLELYPYQQFKELESLYTSDTLELDPEIPFYHDIGQKILEDQPIEDRFDYDSILSEKMPVFWQLKDQLKLVALGDSRCESGIQAELFYGAENRKTSVAYNLAISGGSLEFQTTFVDEYLLKMPNLEWVVYQMSPRVVNRHFERSSERELLKSDGYEFDQKHAKSLWRKSGTDGRKKTVAEISEKRWNRLKAMIIALNEQDVQMLLYLSPFHPIMQGEPVVDDDGTTQEGSRELVDLLRKLQKQFPNFVFVDLIQGGNHDFGHEMFKDLDHLNALGRSKVDTGT